MACIINYNNKTYSLEDFKNILLKDLSLVKEVANKSQERLKAIQEVFNNNPELSKIGDVFSYAIYLDTIFPDSKVKDIVYHGTKAEFEKFSKEFLGKNLGQISKDSNLGFFFGVQKEAKGYGIVFSGEKGKQRIIPAILNITKPRIITSESYVDLANKDADDRGVARRVQPKSFESKLVLPIIQSAKTSNQYDGVIFEDIIDYSRGNQQVVFEPEQIHILGSKQDIEGFKKFVNSSPKVSESRNIFEKVDVTITPDNMVEDDDQKHYSVIENGRKTLVRRISSFLDDYIVNFNKKNETLYEYKAKKEFKSLRIPITERIPVKGITNPLTFDEYVKHLEKVGEQKRVRGKVIHSYIEYYIKRTADSKKQFDDYVEEYKKLGGGDTFEYLSLDYVKETLNKLGVDLDSTRPDKIVSEFKISSDDVMLDDEPLGGTIDLVVKHYDGTYSIVDFKTGYVSFKKKYNNYKYTDIPQNSYNRACIQLASYALLLKKKYPNIKFRNIQIASINPKDGKVFVKDVELNKFIKALKGIFLVLNPTFVSSNGWLFDYKDYYGISRDLVETINEVYGEAGNLNISAQRLIQILQGKLHTLYTENPITVDVDPELKRKAKSLLKQIADLEGGEFGNIFEISKDISFFERATSPGYNVEAPILKLFRKLYERAKLKYFNRVKDIKEDLYGKLNDVLDEYYTNNKVLGNVVKKSAFLKNYMNFVDYEKLFAFAWKETEFGLFGVDEFDFSTNTNLTAAQKSYLLALHTQIRNNYFITLATEEGLAYYGNRLSNYTIDPLADYLGKEEAKKFLEQQIEEIKKYPVSNKGVKQNPGFKYYNGFMPRVSKSFEEKDLKEKVEDFKYGVKDYFSSKSWEQPDKDDKLIYGVPLKYFGDDYQVEEQRHTLNASIASMAFIENLLYKQEMDGVNLVGKAALTYINSIGRGNREPVFKEMSEWLKSYIKNNIEMHAEDSQQYNSDGNLAKTARTITLFTSLVKYALVPFSIFKNLVIEQMFNILKAVAGSINKRSVGDWNGTITISNLLKGYAEFGIYIWDYLTGNLKNNKLHNLDLKYNMMYSSTEYVFGENADPSFRNRGLALKSFFSLNNMVEEFALATIKIAAMDAVKHPETGESMWDLYNSKGEYTGRTRGVLKNGTKVDEFTEQEIVAINKIATTAHGEYDPTLRNQISGMALGIIFTQFHKYIWNTFERAWQGKFENASVGQLQFARNAKGEIESFDMLPVLEWVSQTTEGNARNTFKFIKAYINSVLITFGLENDQMTGKQYWESLSLIEKENVKFVMTQVAAASGIALLQIGMFGSVGTDSDKDKFKKMLLNMQRDMLTEYNLPDLLNTVTKPFVSLEQLKQLYQGIDNFIWKGGVVGKRDKNGNIYGSKQILKNLPGSAQYLNTKDYMNSDVVK